MSDVAYNYRLSTRRTMDLFDYCRDDFIIKRPSRQHERTIDKAIVARILREIEREDIIINEAPEQDITLEPVSMAWWREWNIYDFIIVVGTFLMLVGFMVTLFPDIRKFGALFPVGAALVAIAAFAARRRDDETIA